MQDELKNPDKFTAEQLYNDLLQILIKEVDSEWWDKPKVENALDQMKQNIVDVLVSPHEYFSNKLEFLNFKILLDNNLIRESAEEKGNICQGLDCDLRGIYTKYIQIIQQHPTIVIHYPTTSHNICTLYNNIPQ